MPQKKISSKKSRYSKEASSEEEINEEDFNGEEDVSEDFDKNESADETLPEESMLGQGHSRSRGLFQNVWWKKGVMKGFVVWLVIVIIFYIFDFIGLVEVISKERWFFFLIVLLLLGMAYEKYLFGKIEF